MNIPQQTEHFTPMQHMLLQMFATGIPEENLAEIKVLLADYLARKASEAAAEALEGKDVEEWNKQILSEHIRSSKMSKA